MGKREEERKISKKELQMKNGFTLIELLVVLTIIGMLVGLLLPYLMRAKCRSSEGAAKTYISSLETAIAMYKEEEGIFPISEDKFSSKVLYVELYEKPRELKSAGKEPYIDFKKENLCDDNTICSKDKWPYFYRNNWAQNRGKEGGELVGHNKYGVDIWTIDCDYLRKEKLRIGGNGCFRVTDPESLEKGTRIKNW